MYRQYAEQARARGDIYQWLAGAFYLPGKEMLGENFVSSLMKASRSLRSTTWKQDADLLAGAVNSINELQPLTIEYCRLFYGPNSLEAPPYESVYRDGHRLMGDSTMEVIRKYRAEGLEVLETANELPDHTSVEMEFMFYLSTREAEAWENGDAPRAMGYLAKQQAFLRGHLVRWIPEFCDQVTRTTRTEFYRAVAGIAKKFILEDATRVDALARLMKPELQ